MKSYEHLGFDETRIKILRILVLRRISAIYNMRGLFLASEYLATFVELSHQIKQRFRLIIKGATIPCQRGQVIFRKRQTQSKDCDSSEPF